MIDLTTLFTYIAIVLGFVFIPGPATLLSTTRAVSSGTKVGIATGMGIAVGDLFHTSFAIVGISAIIATSATLFTLIKYIGAAYLVYLGIRAMLEKTSLEAATNKQSMTATKAFYQAILIEVLNPKTALFFLAFLPQFVRAGSGPFVIQLAVLGIVFVFLGLFSTIVFSISAGKLRRFLHRHPAALKWQGKIVGSIYCSLGARLAFQEK